MSATPTPPLPTIIIWNDDLEPHNPVDFADWPTKFKTCGEDDSMRYDPGQKRAAKFPSSAWQAKPEEDVVVSAFIKIIEYRCPKDHVISIGDSFTFHGLENLVTTDNMGSGVRETYASACKRYTKGKEVAAAALDMDQPSSFHSSQVSVLDCHRAAFRSTGDKVAGQRLLDKLTAVPMRADLFVNGSVYNREPVPLRPFRCVFLGEAKPPTGSMRTQIAYLVQALKYAVIGRDMLGTVHVLLMVGMGFRRIVCDRTNDDVYVDIGTKAGGEVIEVEEMSLIELLWYGHVQGAPPQMPTVASASAGLASTSQAPVPATADAAKSRGVGQVKAIPKAKAKNKPYSRPPPNKANKIKNPSPLADKLFYHLSKPDPSSPRPRSDADARHALISFLDHMGQTHFDILGNVDETPESPLRGLTGRWARVRDVKLEQLGSAAITIKACWSDLPVGDTETTSSQNLEGSDAKDDDGGDIGSNDDDEDDDHGPEGEGEGGNNDEEDDDGSRRTPRSPPVDGLPPIGTGFADPNERSGNEDEKQYQYPSTGDDMFWDTLGVSAFKREQEERDRERLERRRAWLEQYEPFTRVRS
jgi:hypothetical protein